MKLKYVLGIPLLSLVFATNVYSQKTSYKHISSQNTLSDNSLLSANYYETEAQTNPPKDALDLSGFEVGAGINKIRCGIFFSNSKMQIGVAAERDCKGSPTNPGIGAYMLKFGIEANYFLRDEKSGMKIIRPYIGSELKYEGENYFPGIENVYYRRRGAGLEGKFGAEFKPLINRKIRAFLELGYDYPVIDKKSIGYPRNPEVKIDRLIGTIGIKF